MHRSGVALALLMACTGPDPLTPTFPITAPAPAIVTHERAPEGEPATSTPAPPDVAPQVVPAPPAGDPGAVVDAPPIEGPAAEFLWSEPVRGLALGLALGKSHFATASPIYPRLALKNVSRAPITVVSHVRTHETHLDPFALTLASPVPLKPGGNCSLVWSHQGVTSRPIALTDSRDKSVTEFKTLAPGEVLTHVIDLRGWLLRPRNGGYPLAPNFYSLEVTYEVEDWQVRRAKQKLWTGELKSEGRTFTILGNVAPELCQSFRTP
jgi:hypothetical protein